MIQGVRYELRFVFFTYGCPTVPAPFVEKIILSLWNRLGMCVKNQLTTHVWVYFWMLFCSFDVYLYIYIYIYTHTHIYVYIYQIYIDI